MNNDLNQTLQQIIALHDSGGNPSQVMQNLFQMNPQVGQMQTQMKNMSNGKSPMEFIMQIAKQNGVSEQNLQGIARILGAKK